MSWKVTRIAVRGPGLPTDEDILDTVHCSRQHMFLPVIYLTLKKRRKRQIVRYQGRNDQQLKVSVIDSTLINLASVHIEGPDAAHYIQIAGQAKSLPEAMLKLRGLLQQVYANLRT